MRSLPNLVVEIISIYALAVNANIMEITTSSGPAAEKFNSVRMLEAVSCLKQNLSKKSKTKRLHKYVLKNKQTTTKK